MIWYDVLYHTIAPHGNPLPAKKVVLALADHLQDVHVVKVGMGIGQPQAHHSCLVHRSRLQRCSANAERPQGFSKNTWGLDDYPNSGQLLALVDALHIGTLNDAQRETVQALRMGILALAQDGNGSRAPAV
jgi:hypothetical protein